MNTVDGFHHIGLYTKDINKSLEFYTEGLGGVVTFSFQTNDGRTLYMVDLGNNAVVELIPHGEGNPQANPRWAHIALRTSNARADYAKAIQAGAACQSEPNDMMLGTMAVCNAFVLGPDEEVIEFFQVK